MPPKLFYLFISVVVSLILYTAIITVLSILGISQSSLNILCVIGKLLTYFGGAILVSILLFWWLKRPSKNKSNRNNE